jgi:folate-dependent phosphoribosylglycinamide formyltransferase PurN
MHAQEFERMKHVEVLLCACIRHEINSRTGIPCDYFNLISNGFLRKEETDRQKEAEGRQKYDAALAAKILSIDKQRPELIVHAGWMHIFSNAFLEPIERAGVRVINIHPALSGKFSEINLGLATYSLHRGVRRSYGD